MRHDEIIRELLRVEHVELSVDEAILLLSAEQIRLQRESNRMLGSIEHLLTRTPAGLQHKFQGANTMPIQLTVGQTLPDVVTESNANGNVPVVGANITFTSSDTTIVSVVNNGDGTAVWTAVAPGTVTVTYADTAFTLSTTDTITVVAAVEVPTAIAHQFGTPS